MKSLSLPMIAALVCVTTIRSYAQSYDVTVHSQPFVHLENAQLAVAEPWDIAEFQVPIGFDFEFFDITTDQFYSIPNSYGGEFELNPDVDHTYWVLPFFSSLVDRGYSQDSFLSPIYYQTQGKPGNRVFTLEHYQAGFFEGTEDTNYILQDYISFQVRLFEATGDVEFHIGPYIMQEDPGIIFEGNPGPIIGLIADAESEEFGGYIGELIVLEVDPLKPTIETEEVVTFVNWPIPENTVYRFTRTNTAVSDIPDKASHPLLLPNPTTGEIRLRPDVSDDIIYPVQVTNSQGVLVASWQDQSEISATGFPAGCYYVMVRTQDIVRVEKLLVVHD